MTGRAAPLGIAMAILVLSIALALVLIPILDERLRRATARKTTALAQLAEGEQQKDRLA